MRSWRPLNRASISASFISGKYTTSTRSSGLTQLTGIGCPPDRRADSSERLGFKGGNSSPSRMRSQSPSVYTLTSNSPAAHLSALTHTSAPPIFLVKYEAMAQAVASSHRDLDLQHIWHGNMQHRGLEARPPLEIAGADGCYVVDADGRRYLDAMAGLFCVNVGYGRREIADAVTVQMAQLAYYPLTQSHGAAATLAARLAGLLPEGLGRVFFSNSGSEAVATALKMARPCAL